MIGNSRFGLTGILLLSLLLSVLPSRASQVASNVTVNYAVIYLHVTIGAGRWSLSMSGNRYAAAASGEVKGMMSLLINGEGSGHAEGVVARGKSVPVEFAAHVVSTAEKDDIGIAFQNGSVKEVHALPPFPSIPKRVALNTEDLVDVSDPLSAVLGFMGGGDGGGASPCERRLRIFDGRRRFDVALSYKRTQIVSVPPAFQGGGTVCSAQLFPIAGQQVKNSALDFLVESKDLEIEYVSIAEAHAYVPIAATLPTLIGTVHVNATGLTIANGQ
jgi:Protein of unknown function (DUF3108)